MSFSFEHPNAGGVLLPGQTCCHTGKLIRRKIHGDPLADPLLPELCPKLCSPIGVFPKDHDKPKKKPSGSSEDASDGEDEENKENGVPNPKSGAASDSDDDDDPSTRSGALPLESSPARLAGCAPCGSAFKWSCCNACCGPCTLWSKDGFLSSESATPNPTAREYASRGTGARTSPRMPPRPTSPRATCRASAWRRLRLAAARCPLSACPPTAPGSRRRTSSARSRSSPRTR
jgi:hypothetical protein